MYGPLKLIGKLGSLGFCSACFEVLVPVQVGHAT
jgi:hypothetical protein